MCTVRLARTTLKAGRQLIEDRPLRAALTAIFVALIGVAFAGALCLSASGVLTRLRPDSTALTPNTAMLVIMIPSAVCDCLISGTLALTLKSRERDIGSPTRRTSTIVTKLIRLAIRTAAYTAIVAVVGGALSLLRSSLRR